MRYVKRRKIRKSGEERERQRDRCRERESNDGDVNGDERDDKAGGRI